MAVSLVASRKISAWLLKTLVWLEAFGENGLQEGINARLARSVAHFVRSKRLFLSEKRGARFLDCAVLHVICAFFNHAL